MESSVNRFIDVRDVARAHILALENPSASGRYCLVGTLLSTSEIFKILQKLHPRHNHPEMSVFILYSSIIIIICFKKGNFYKSYMPNVFLFSLELEAC